MKNMKKTVNVTFFPPYSFFIEYGKKAQISHRDFPAVCSVSPYPTVTGALLFLLGERCNWSSDWSLQFQELLE